MARAGRYRHLVIVQQQTRVPDGRGGYGKDWSDLIEVKAEVQPAAIRVSGGRARFLEPFQAGQLEYTNTFQVTMRFLGNTTVTPANRLIWEDAGNNRILDIQSVINPDGRRRELLMVCVERVPGPGPVE